MHRRQLVRLRRRRIARGITQRYWLGNRDCAVGRADHTGSRATLVVGPVNVRRNEEQNLVRLTRYQFALEEIAEDWNARNTRRAILRGRFVIAKHSTYHRGATVWNQDFSLHSLRVNAGSAVDGNRGIDAVVLRNDV